MRYNAAADLIERNVSGGRSSKRAFVDDRGSYTYGEVAKRVNRFANALAALGIEPEQRVLLCLHDGIDFPTAFLGCIMAGVVPIAVNTLLTTGEYAYMLEDSRARAIVLSEPLVPVFAPLLGSSPFIKRAIVSGADACDHLRMSDLLESSAGEFVAASTVADDICFWLYSSGSTGPPKGTVHIHSSLVQTAELYGVPVLGIEENDVVMSAAKLFFAYGLGNGLTFPMFAGATSVLMAERATPPAVFARLREHRVSIFYGVPTLYAAMLSSPGLPAREDVRLRRCVSAGEALPEEIGRRWTRHFGVDVLDGIGSTEMLHIFLSNRPGDVRYGTTGKPVPGYDVQLTGEAGEAVAPGEVGDLAVAGPTSAIMYWNQRERSRSTFQGAWTRTGDKYSRDAEGYYTYAGRSDDMLKVSGMYVSPIEVESALMAHEAVLECAVCAKEDAEKLVKPIAFVVLKAGFMAGEGLREDLKQHVKNRLAPYKYPRWLEFVDELPKTATGKIQRFKLRETAAEPSEPVTAAQRP